jgi:hypothetical protein
LQIFSPSQWMELRSSTTLGTYCGRPQQVNRKCVEIIFKRSINSAGGTEGIWLDHFGLQVRNDECTDKTRTRRKVRYKRARNHDERRMYVQGTYASESTNESMRESHMRSIVSERTE